MNGAHWAAALGVLLVAGLLVKKATDHIQNMATRRTILGIALVILVLLDHAIFDVGIPTARDQLNNQTHQCTGSAYYQAGCPGYGETP